MKMVKGAIAEDTNHVARRCMLSEMAANRIGVAQVLARFAGLLNIRNEPLWIQSLTGFEKFKPGDLSNEDGVRFGKGVRQFSLKHIASRGVAPGFEGHPELLIGIGHPQGVDGFTNRCGVVTKIINDGDVIDMGTDFHASLDPFK